MATKHTMQAALALSPVNKAQTALDNGDIFLLQEYEHEKYRMWVVAPGDIPVWGGLLKEDELNSLHEKYGVRSGQVWEPLGIAPDHSEEYKTIDAAIRLLSGHILNLRTELLVIKAQIGAQEEKSE